MLLRHPDNPILTRVDVPPARPDLVDPSSVFNPGAVRYRGRFLLLVRVQSRARETALMPAWSDDGERFSIEPLVVLPEGLERIRTPIHHVYDPRLSVIDGLLHVVFAADTDDGTRLAVARGRNLGRLELLSFDHKGDRRNGVLFPRRVDGCYLRLERPNRTHLPDRPPTGSTIVLAESEDLVEWREVGPVLSGRPRRWDELIGSGPPPIEVQQGWLHVYHGVATHFMGNNVYQAGACLLDRDDPTIVLGRTRGNILEPRAPYEVAGQVPNVVFPTGLVVDAVGPDGVALPDARVFLYYGAADTVIGLATTTVAELVAACEEP